MCSYKVVKVFFEVWGFQGRVESGVHRVSTMYAICSFTHFSGYSRYNSERS